MATVPRNSSAANLSVPPTTAAQVEDRIAVVNAVYAAALKKVSGGFGPLASASEQADHFASALHQLKSNIDAWAARGRAGTPATAKMGWPGWIEAGNTYKDGINQIANTGVRERLRDIISVVKDVPANAVKDVAHGIAKAADLIEAGGSGLVRALWKPVAFVAVSYFLLLYIVRKGVG